MGEAEIVGRSKNKAQGTAEIRSPRLQCCDGLVARTVTFRNG